MWALLAGAVCTSATLEPSTWAPTAANRSLLLGELSLAVADHNLQLSAAMAGGLAHELNYEASLVRHGALDDRAEDRMGALILLERAAANATDIRPDLNRAYSERAHSASACDRAERARLAS